MNICQDEECNNSAIKDGLCRLHLWFKERLNWQEAREQQRSIRSQTICIIEDCGKPVVARGLCNTHYARWREHGDANFPTGNLGWGYTRFRKDDPRYDKRCSFEGCDRIFYAKNLCLRHFEQQREGKPLTPIRPRYEGDTCYVPDCDKKRIGKYCPKHRYRLNRYGDFESEKENLITMREIAETLGITHQRVHQLLIMLKSELSLSEGKARSYLLKFFQKGRARKSLGLSTRAREKASNLSEKILNLKLGESIFIPDNKPSLIRRKYMKLLPPKEFRSILTKDYTGVWFIRVKEQE